MKIFDLIDSDMKCECAHVSAASQSKNGASIKSSKFLVFGDFK